MAVTLEAGKPGAKRGGPVPPAINVTPLVDVVLVLLIIFMVVTPLLNKEFKIHLPKKDDNKEQPPPENDTRIVLTVSKEGTIRINRDAIDDNELADKLPRMLAARSDKVVYFDADDEAPYALVVQTLDRTRRAGGKAIAILTEKVAQ